jgi:N-carbamoyl-L-amino-acid hydrolase
MSSGREIAARLESLERIGVGPDGVMRLAWTDDDAAAGAWFAAQAGTLGMAVQRDPAGNLWACPEGDGPWWGVGSHLDSVRGGGHFDGPLGVGCGFEVAAALADVPVAVLSFADEEGARFNTPTFGSKALAGRLELPAVLAREDDGGAALGDAMRAHGVDPERIGEAPGWLARLAGFVEIHIDQSTELGRMHVPIGVVSALASRRRLEIELLGRADHAGTTPPADRRDALSAAARMIVAAEELGRGLGGLTVTTSRILAEPNASTTIASRVRLWIDARWVHEDEIDAWERAVRQFADGLRERTGVAIAFSVASRSPGREFSSEVRAALIRAGEAVTGRPVPEVVCFAGHDAGVLAERIPAGMVLVRNDSGVSHSPEETVDLDDAAVAVKVVARALTVLAATGGVS